MFGSIKAGCKKGIAGHSQQPELQILHRSLCLSCHTHSSPKCACEYFITPASASCDVCGCQGRSPNHHPCLQSVHPASISIMPCLWTSGKKPPPSSSKYCLQSIGGARIGNMLSLSLLDSATSSCNQLVTTTTEVALRSQLLTELALLCFCDHQRMVQEGTSLAPMYIYVLYESK